jgi:hypothetical protein
MQYVTGVSRQHAWRAGDTCPAGKGQPKSPDEPQEKMSAERHAAMTWAQRLDRNITIDV